MKTPPDLENDDLFDIVCALQERLFWDMDSAGNEFWNPDKISDTKKAYDDIVVGLREYDLVPHGQGNANSNVP